MSSELSRTELSCLITHKKGFAFKSKDYIPSGVPVVRVSNFTWDSISTDDLRYVSHEVASSTKVVQLNEYDVIVATVGSWPQNPDSIVGKVVRVPCPLSGALLNQNTVRLRVNDDNLVNQKYLYIALKTKEFSDHLISKAQGSANQASITLSDIFSYAIPWGTYTQRKYIVNVIDSINDKIVIANQINQTLEQMAQALFKSWFVDFEPVKAKIAVLEAGGSQEDATRAAMTTISGKDADALAFFEREHPAQYAELKATAELFPSAMKNSEVGAIPEGWSVASISEMGKVTCGKTPSKKEPEYFGDDIPFIKIPDMHGQLFVLKTNEYLSAAGSNSQLKKLVPANSICVSCIATIGVVSITNEPSHTNQQINSVTPYKSSLLYYLYFSMLGLKDYLHVLGSAGSATLNVNTSTFSGIKIAQPDDKVLELFHAKCTHLFNEIKSLSVQTESLTQLRDTLLPKLLSGEITLPEAEQVVSEAENV
ncbi:restriction endonuclease subunit S [Escherichia coli]|uniref:restriction endonuclease subunit S n=1 Tax=Citrobacter portucalensis TaxID=1639133 RepID=UPI0015801316|nr:restriction endonuclease subunit S [Citrobacter portucalensis]MBI1677908.1 restriction endonuclease subunit S [Citrobacter portucalensis]NUE70983.1 restriction endonuclease subunit S [Escherichia coli]